MILSPRSLRAATSNVARKLLYGHVADLRAMPTQQVGTRQDSTRQVGTQQDGARKTERAGTGQAGAGAAGERPRRVPVYRYRVPEGLVPAGPPVLFVPPPAAPARCYDLRRGCSLAEHVVNAGRLSYLLDHGPAGPDAMVGPDGGGSGEWAGEWAREVLPEAIRAVSRDAGGQPVQLVGWCLGGVLGLLAAADPGLPVASVAMVAAPVDGRVVRAGAVARPISGGLARFDPYLVRPFKILTNLDNGDYLAQIEAVDHFTGTMASPSARTVRRIYSALLRDLEGVAGAALDGVRVPVLAIAGRDDGLAPVRAVHPVTRLLPNAPEVRFEIAPGGHLGVLTGRRARTTTWAHLDRWLDEGIVRHGIRPHRREAAATP